jgi:hypothetical protein
MSYLLIKLNKMRVLVKQFDNANRLGISKKVIIVALLLLFMPFKGLSQNESIIISKSEFESGISQSRSVISKFKKLSKSLNPSIIIEDNQLKVINNNPVCLVTDYASNATINGLVSNKKKIEYASIRIKNPSELDATINLTSYTDFKDLKYIHLIFEYSITDADMQALIENPLIKCYIIYESREIM